jgi:hypothetical protein
MRWIKSDSREGLGKFENELSRYRDEQIQR